MNIKEIKHNLLSCSLPTDFKKNIYLSDALGFSAATPFNFPPFPEKFRTEIWCTLGKKSDISISENEDFATAYARYVQEGFMAAFNSEKITIQEYSALKLTFLEQKQFKKSEQEVVMYKLETQAIALFLNENHILHVYFSYDVKNKTEALSVLDICLNSMKILGNATIWEKAIKKEKVADEAFWAAQEEEERLQKRNQRIIEDEKLGTLVPQPNPNLKVEENTWWRSEMAFDSYHFKLDLNLGINDEEENKVRAIANRILENFEAHEDQAKQMISDEFCILFNDAWRQDEPKISTTTFKNRIQLETVEIDKNLECRFWYDDDDMFGKHGLLVSFYLKENGEWAETHTEMFG